ncbi:MAG: PilZ domain-containing protein [Candidatus Eremiobacteraeota bacterium]|nr:PilZ domain-containing protein [Candidatus Eremiobacteraeota bacterium]
MFAGLMEWYGSRADDRREAPRTRHPYKVVYSSNGLTWSPVMGIDIGVGGISVLTQHGFHKNELDFKLTLGSRIIPCRMSVVRHEGAIQGGNKLHKYALRFVSMTRDDQDAMLRWLRGAPLEERNKAQEQLAEKAVHINHEDVNRLFPKAIQNRLHEELVKRHRLAPLDPKREPLVAYYYAGTTVKQGKRLHHLTIESKVAHTTQTHQHREARHRTRFEFDDNADNISVLD